MKKVLPSNVIKNVQYDLKRDPARYVSSTKKICDIMGDSCTVSFLPTCRSNTPSWTLKQLLRYLYLTSNEKSGLRQKDLQHTGVEEDSENAYCGQEAKEWFQVSS